MVRLLKNKEINRAALAIVNTISDYHDKDREKIILKAKQILKAMPYSSDE